MISRGQAVVSGGVCVGGQLESVVVVNGGQGVQGGVSGGQWGSGGSGGVSGGQWESMVVINGGQGVRGGGG